MKKVLWSICAIVTIVGSYYISTEVLSKVSAKEDKSLEDAFCVAEKEFIGKKVEYKPNQFCKTTCTPKGKRVFPDHKNSVDVDGGEQDRKSVV